MCQFVFCNRRCPYKKCSSTPSKNHLYIHSKRNNGPVDLYSLQPTNDILVVFEAPGIDEWRKGEPICSQRRGSAAYKFNTELSKQGKQKSNYDIAEAVRCFPGTSTTSSNQKKQQELDEAAKHCKKYLKAIILNKNYKKIVCFGEVAKKSVTSIMHSLIKKHHHHYNRVYLKSKVIGLIHPMKNPNLSQDISTHL